MRTRHLWSFFVLATAVLIGCEPQPGAMVVDVPKLDAIMIDGDPADWSDEGFRVSWLSHMRTDGGDLPGPAELDPTFRLAWTDEGLLVLLAIRDDAFVPAPDDESLWANKADVAILYLIPQRGGERFTRIAVAPNLTDIVGKYRAAEPLRVLVSVDATQTDREEQPSGYRAVDLEAEDGDIRAARGAVENGYVLEVLVPWQVAGVAGHAGSRFGVQVAFVDTDPGVDDDAPAQQGGAVWFPEMGTAEDTTRSHIAHLTHHASAPQVASVTDHGYRRGRDYEIAVEGASELIGETAEVRAAGKRLAAGAFVPGEDGWALAVLRFGAPPWQRGFDQVDVLVGGRTLETVRLPNARRTSAYTLLLQDLEAHPYSFDGQRLPYVGFENPERVAAVIGPFDLNVTVYDADYNVVTRAETPGRYGAVAEVIPHYGRPFRRFLTLFRRPEEPSDEVWDEWEDDVAPDFSLPEWLGGPSDDLSAYPRAQHEAWWGSIRWLIEEPYGPVFLNWLHEKPAGATLDDFYTRPRQLDRAWWLGLKRTLYGWDQRWPEPVVCPRPIEGAPAPVVREGTLEEAGMKDDTPEKLDDLLSEWADNSDEAFAVCVVRRGVIVHHEAYGERDDDDMEVDTKSWMASITKMLSGTLVMMLVDQGRMDLDDPIQDYLPALAGLHTNRPLTIRRLYNHSGDLDWHFGHHVNDMEERMTSIVPVLNVGAEYHYNGTGMELVCKALEAVSGETLPAFFKNHLLDPLGCENTDVGSASHDADSIPLDMARIAQMLLNKGAYGDMRFFSEATFEQMLPKPVIVNGQPGSTEYGVGTVWTNWDGLSDQTFSHGAASAATMWMDPANELVIIMTRNDAGENFYQYHHQFIQAIIDGLIDPAPAAGEAASE